MKIYISADIEGIGCVVRGEHASTSGRDYDTARRLMTQEVNAAIRGAFDAGAREVTVCDAHNTGPNLLPESLDKRAVLVMGGSRRGY
ncbi:peptidase M55 [Desulfonema ishimotonii]|uniref:Peptidase M55 n=1 Tax=Desulfonema ishimotonii TaxID=45657 RepID=A0A401G3X1_9BACT|nr:peptidase M55 [Desulfonema ishimotonii]